MQQNQESLQSELITFDNIEEALILQHSIFPREDAKENYLDGIKQNIEKKVKRRLRTEYYVVKHRSEIIGLWGHYIVDNKDECWLGWYGVKNEERNKGYGTLIFNIFENWARTNGFKTIRLYTDEIDNAKACNLYERMGMTKEYYLNSDDITKDIGRIVIYSKSLTNDVVKLWNNKFINYKGQRAKEHNIDDKKQG